MKAVWGLVGCASLLSGCSVVDGVLSSEQTLDPTKIYLGPFDRVETPRFDVDQYKCLSGSPLLCDTFSITVSCWCAY